MEKASDAESAAPALKGQREHILSSGLQTRLQKGLKGREADARISLSLACSSEHLALNTVFEMRRA